MADTVTIDVEFTYDLRLSRVYDVLADHHRGGLEMLFSNQRNHKVSVPARDQDGKPENVAFLIKHLCDNLMTDQKKELFLLDESV